MKWGKLVPTMVFVSLIVVAILAHAVEGGCPPGGCPTRPPPIFGIPGARGATGPAGSTGNAGIAGSTGPLGPFGQTGVRMFVNKGPGNATFVVPDDVTSVLVRVWGAGGGGSGYTFDTAVGGRGGFGGKYVQASLTVAPGDTLELHSGTGGIGGQTANAGDPALKGQPGGVSIVSKNGVVQIQAGGGAGGNGPTGINVGNANCIPSSSTTTALVTLFDQDGQKATTTFPDLGGNGGDAAFGGTGAYGGDESLPAEHGNAPGGGGGGMGEFTTGRAGDGAHGRVIVFY
jgi:hypothetical protein